MTGKAGDNEFISKRRFFTRPAQAKPEAAEGVKVFSHYSLGEQTVTEKELVERAKTDSESFGILYDVYLHQIYGFILKRVGNVAVAEDITSLTFEKALRKLKDFQWQNVSFGAWLYTIASNTIIDHFRETGRKQKVDIDSVPDIKDKKPAVDVAVSQKLFFEQIQGILPSLDDDDQTVLTMKLFAEKSNDEICQVVGLSRAHVAVKIHRALKKLRIELKKRGISY